MSRTTDGRDFMADALFATTQPNPAIVLALSDVSYAVPAQGSNGHSTMGGNTSSELHADGLDRATAVYSHSVGAQTATLQHTFTNSAAAGTNPHTIYEVAVFSPTTAGVAGAHDTGKLVFEMAEPNPPPLSGTDTVNQTVTVDLGS